MVSGTSSSFGSKMLIRSVFISLCTTRNVSAQSFSILRIRWSGTETRCGANTSAPDWNCPVLVDTSLRRHCRLKEVFRGEERDVHSHTSTRQK